MKKLLLVSVLLLSLFVVACGEKVSMTTLSDWQNYSIVRPDTGGRDGDISAAQTIMAAIRDKAGVRLELTTDWVKRGESAPVGTKEILIGYTNRPESDCDLKYNDFVVKFENDRIVIGGGSNDAVIAAAEWYAENCIDKDGVSYPTEAYIYRDEYSLENVSIGGIAISDYAVDGGDKYTEEAKALSLYIAENAGGVASLKKNLEIPTIRIGEDASLSFLEYGVTTDKNGVSIAVGENGVDISYALEMFYQALENTAGEFSVNEKKAVEFDNIKICDDAQIKEWRKETDAHIEKIRNSPNMEIPSEATVYYLSPSGDDMNDGKSPKTAWKTLDRLNSGTYQQGTYVCFERGGLWRGQVKVAAGVTYTAYGTGAKPMIYGSPEDGGNAASWTKTDVTNVWQYKTAFKEDVGTMVFNDGEAHAIKLLKRTDGSDLEHATKVHFTGYQDIQNDLNFYQDLETGVVYLYSEQNPGERFQHIEFNVKHNVFAVSSMSNVTIDNICVKYGGAHGVGAGTVSNLTVQNCEFGWIGGTIQYYENGLPTRYGNAIEIYGGCDVYNVTDNYIYQVYDAGITQQVRVSSDGETNGKFYTMKHMNYSRNVIEYCNYSIEYFLSRIPEGNKSYMEDFVIADNDMWYAGMGLCTQRPDKSQAAHIKGWSGSARNRCKDFRIDNNRMVISDGMFMQVCSDLYNADGSDSMPTLTGNTYANYIGRDFGTVAMSDNNRVTYNASIPDYLGEKSNDEMFWFLR